MPINDEEICDDSDSDYDSYYGDDESEEVEGATSDNEDNPNNDSDSIIAATISLLVAEKKQCFEGGANDNADDNTRLLNSYIVFPNPCKLTTADTEALAAKVTAGQKRNTKLLRNMLKDHALFRKENLQHDIKNKMICHSCVEHCLEVGSLVSIYLAVAAPLHCC